MLRFFSRSLLAGLLTLTLFTATSRADDNACTIAIKGEENAVTKACKEGGIKAAKTVMKKMQKAGKAKKLTYDCGTCHKDETAGNWTLTKDAESKFKELLAAQ